MRGYYGTLGITQDEVLTTTQQPATPWAGQGCVTDANCNQNLFTQNTSAICVNFRCQDFVGDYAYGTFFARPENPSTGRFLIPWQDAIMSNANPRTTDQVVLREVQWLRSGRLSLGYLPPAAGKS